MSVILFYSILLYFTTISDSSMAIHETCPPAKNKQKKNMNWLQIAAKGCKSIYRNLNVTPCQPHNCTQPGKQVQSRGPGNQCPHKQKTVSIVGHFWQWGVAFMTEKFYHNVVIDQADILQ